MTKDATVHQHQHQHQQHHHHEHVDDIDWSTIAAELERGAEIDRQYLEAATGWLAELAPGATRVLDVGSGPGVISCLLAQAFPAAEVVAVDGSEALLERAAARAERAGVGDRVTTRQAELPAAFDELGAADLVWTSDVLHHLGDQQAALSQLAGLLRPGGLLAVAEGGLPPRFLPRDIGIGRPGLQARLDVARSDWFDGMRASLPDSTAVVEHWPAMLTRAGLSHVATRSFLTDLPAPADDTVREYLHDLLERQREQLVESLDATDVATVDALIDRDAPDGIMRRDDVYLLTASTVHVARTG